MSAAFRMVRIISVPPTKKRRGWSRGAMWQSGVAKLLPKNGDEHQNAHRQSDGAEHYPADPDEYVVVRRGSQASDWREPDRPFTGFMNDIPLDDSRSDRGV